MSHLWLGTPETLRKPFFIKVYSVTQKTMFSTVTNMTSKSTGLFEALSSDPYLWVWALTQWKKRVLWYLSLSLLTCENGDNYCIMRRRDTAIKLNLRMSVKCNSPSTEYMFNKQPLLTFYVNAVIKTKLTQQAYSQFKYEWQTVRFFREMKFDWHPGWLAEGCDYWHTELRDLSL